MKKPIKKTLTFLLAIMLAAGLSACSTASTAATAAESAEAETTVSETAAQTSAAASSDTSDPVVTIVYTNDIHAYIANVITEKDADGNTTEKTGLRISKISQMVKDLRNDGKEVLLVDAGDEIQGTSYGLYDEGASVIKIMNEAGYQLATMGNHEFDFGVGRLLELENEKTFPYISCNFKSAETNETYYDAYKIFEANGKKIAFIGITTPETFSNSAPELFKDDKGNYLCTFDGTENPEDLYNAVQKAIDEVKDKADYVIALGHLGVGKEALESKISSIDVIANTTGLDAFIDGHSHTVIENETYKDKSGNDVLLTQTGAYLANAGIMEISTDGSISTRLIQDYESADPDVETLENNLIASVDLVLGEKIAELDTTLYITNPEDENQRLIRAMELNMGDFIADGYYWSLNEAYGLDCDIAFQNGGGLRANIAAGDVTRKNIRDVLPFGNMLCIISATGQQIKDALEMGVANIGQWDAEWNAPAENGGFMHVAGMKYTVDASVPSSVKTNSDGSFISVDGQYRVCDIEVYNRQTEEYEPIDLNKSYNVAGIDYLLQNGGNGLSMFTECKPIADYIGQESNLIAAYACAFAKSGDYALINTANCPLSAYKGYMINYENPYGAGRITINNLSYDK